MLRIWTERFSRIVTRGAAVASKRVGSSRLRSATPRESWICEDVVNATATAIGCCTKECGLKLPVARCITYMCWPGGNRQQVYKVLLVSVAYNLIWQLRPFLEIPRSTEIWKGSRARDHRIYCYVSDRHYILQTKANLILIWFISCACKLYNSNTLIIKISLCPFVGYNANANAYTSRYHSERRICTNAFAM